MSDLKEQLPESAVADADTDLLMANDPASRIGTVPVVISGRA